MNRNRIRLVALAATAALALSACSDDPAEDPAADLEGDPIALSVIASGEGPIYQPEIFNAAQAAADAINRDGGVKDPTTGDARPIKIIPCEADTASNANAAVQCARNAIEDDVVAAVSKYVSSDPAVETFADAGIPLVGTITQTGQDFANEFSFPLAGGSPMLSAGAGAALQDVGAQSITLVSADLASGRVLPDFMKPVLDSPDDLVQSVFLPVDNSADLTSFFSQIANEAPDGVAILTSTDLTIKTILGLRQAGYEGKIAAISAAITEESLPQLGEAGEGLVIASDYEAASSDTDRMNEFNDELDEWDEAHGESTARSAFAINAWASVHYVADQLAGVDAIDAAALIASMEGAEVDLGVAPPFTFGGEPNFLQLPRLPRATVQVQQARGGEIVALEPGKFLDLNELAK